MRLLLVISRGFTSVGESFVRAAEEMGHETMVIDTAAAFAAPRAVRMFTWHLRGHRPPRLRAFGQTIVKASQQFRPDVLVTTGQSPVPAEALEALHDLGVQTLNYSTDDPWNRFSGGAWFFEALRQYDAVFTPRRANEADLRRLGVRHVEYLPFGYDPLHCVGPGLSTEDAARYDCDVVFVGGADRDRAPILKRLVDAGLKVHLYGAKWNRYAWAKQAHQGNASPEEVRKATLGARISLCIVRRSNRDGHVMRTFEMAASGGCMLVEDSDEHRALLGPSERNVYYFDTPETLLAQVHRLLQDADRRAQLRARVASHIVDGHNTYADRLRSMLACLPIA